MLRRVFARHALLFLLLLPAYLASGAERPPNIVFILADDLGYSELGCYGQKKIQTPNIDKLAQQGMRFTQHYAGNAVCAPSRCVLMTGKHPGHAWVRDNREMKPEGQYPLPADAVTLAMLLKQSGYATGAFGKWGLGPPDSVAAPLKKGFHRFYGYNCQMLAHNYYPQTLWDDDKRTSLDNPKIPLNAKLPAGADPNSTASYARFTGKEYSADLIAEKGREFVKAHKDGPFFMYWPMTVPHLALQVPEDSRAPYEGKWPDAPYVGGHSYLPNIAPRATYAAMVTRMDTEVGRLMALLRDLKLEENTIVVFTSDNGPTHDKIGGSDSEFFESADGLRGVKGSLYEGGVRVPLIVRWPGHVKPGTTNDRVTGFEDWIPTLTQIAGVAKSALPSGLDGESFVDTLEGKQQPERKFLYREFPAYGGQQSVRVGDWKLVRQNLGGRKPSEKSPTMELYNLKDDPGEQHDLAAAKPEVVEQLKNVMAEQHVKSEEFPIAAVDGVTTGSAAGGEAGE